MAKGQIATLIIILVVIGAVVYFALPTLQNLPSGGGGSSGGIQINNNIITVESYSVSSLKMFPSEQTTVSFLVQNNGDHTIGGKSSVSNNQQVTVNFYDLGGMVFGKLICDTTEVTNPPYKCSFDLDPFQSEKITLNLQAPDIGSLTTFKISYSIKYSYSGSRSAVIPVIDGITRTTPLGKFTQSTSTYSPTSAVPSYGPLELSYSFPSTGTTEQNGQVITQNWAVNGQAFRLQIKLSHIGTLEGSKFPKLTGIVLTPSNNLELKHNQANDFCPYDGNPTMETIKEISDVTSNPLVLNCQFTPKIGENVPESNAEVSTTFSYDYTILRSQTFTVQPYEQKR